jgi:putative oxidoreductase
MIDALDSLTSYRRLVLWQWTHNSMAIDLVRIFVGGALFVRGLAYAADPDILLAFAGERAVDLAKYYILVSHIGGGAMLMMGLLTRLAAATILPIMIVAVFFVHLSGGFGTANQSLELSALIMVILSTLLVFGAGRFSLDYRIFGARIEATSKS